MGISIEFADDAELQAKIKVVGVGGSGGNALNTMIQAGLEGVIVGRALYEGALALPEAIRAAACSSLS